MATYFSRFSHGFSGFPFFLVWIGSNLKRKKIKRGPFLRTLIFYSIFSVPKISIRKQDRRPKPLETGAVGRVRR